MSDRICPECGSDIYRASHYDEVSAARDRHMRSGEQQAVEILRLKLRVAELEDERKTRGRKVEQQRRTIRRLEAKLRESGIWPHDDRKSGEGDPASPTQKHALREPTPVPDYPHPSGIRKMRKRIKPSKRKVDE